MVCMKEETIRRLIRLNNDFYRDNAASFSATRTSAWPGWKRAVAALEQPPRTVFDAACGNLRFKSFIEEQLGWKPLAYHALDSCCELIPDGAEVTFHEADLLEIALSGGGLAQAAGIPPCDLTVCSGFMHHVPGAELLAAVLEELMGCTRAGGVVIVSFWRFADDPKLARKAVRSTSEAGPLSSGLEPGDYLLGWNDVPGAMRYCHSFTEGEIDALAARMAGYAHLIDRFAADGRNGALNGYLVFRRR